jgi:plastocyanin
VKRTALVALVLVCAPLVVPAPPVSATVVQGVILTLLSQQFAPPTVVVPQGKSLLLAQLDPTVRHDVVSRATVSGHPLFATSRTLNAGETAPVIGVEKLRPATYAFTCSIHNGMSGQLIVH